MIRVHIAHDNHLLRDGVAFALSHEPDIKVVEVSPEGRAGLDAFDDDAVDVLILWVPWPEPPFEEVTRYRKKAPTTRIVGLYTHTKMRNEMIAAGADEVVDEAAGLAPLLAAIRRVAPI